MPVNLGNWQLKQEEIDMDFAIGFTLASLIFGPMFLLVWKEDETDEEDAKTLLGSLDYVFPSISRRLRMGF